MGTNVIEVEHLISYDVTADVISCGGITRTLPVELYELNFTDIIEIAYISQHELDNIYLSKDSDKKCNHKLLWTNISDNINFAEVQ